MADSILSRQGFSFEEMGERHLWMRLHLYIAARIRVSTNKATMQMLMPPVANP